MTRDLLTDVNDVIDAADNLGALFLTSLRTKTGSELKRVVYEQLERRQRLAEDLAKRNRSLEAEIDGVREQNAKLTAQLQRAEADLDVHEVFRRKDASEIRNLRDALFGCEEVDE